MKKTFQKTLIAAATGVVLMSAVGTASANSLLFPYFTTATGAQSVLSLYMPGSASATGSGERVHYVYNYGPACTHYDAAGSLTPNDILSHSIASVAAGGFGKVVGSDASTGVYFPLANQTGFLVVSNTTTAALNMRGSMAIVDPSSGLVVSYPGIDNTLDTNIAANEGNFSAAAIGGTDVNFALTSMPSAITTTSWYTVVLGNMSTAITAGTDWTGAARFSNGGNVYNNDEVAYSGSATKRISCAGTLLSTDLMTTAQAAAVGINGGLVKATATDGFTTATGITASPFTGVALMKMQTVQASVGAPFAGKQFLHREQAGF